MFNLFPFLFNNLPNNLGSILGNLTGGMNGGMFSGFLNIDIMGSISNLGNLGNLGNMGNLGGMLNGMGNMNNRNIGPNMNMNRNMIQNNMQEQPKQIQDVQYDVQMKDIGDYYLIRGYLPGINPKDVDINIEGNKAIFTVKNDTTYSNNKTSSNRLKKDFYIGEVDPSKMSAVFRNDVLLLAIPKVKKIEEPKQEGPKIIDVESYDVK